VYIIFTLSHPTASFAYSAKSICIWPNVSVSAFIPIHKHGHKWPLRRLKVKIVLKDYRARVGTCGEDFLGYEENMA
jgi:hypothetical protein